MGGCAYNHSPRSPNKEPNKASHGDGSDAVCNGHTPRPHLLASVDLGAAVATQYFVTRTDVTQANLSQNRRQNGRNGRRTSSCAREHRGRYGVCQDSAELGFDHARSPFTILE
jgi:hypothetical protein